MLYSFILQFSFLFFFFFFFIDAATTEIYTYCHTLSLHDALPICQRLPDLFGRRGVACLGGEVCLAEGGQHRIAAIGRIAERRQHRARLAGIARLGQPEGLGVAIRLLAAQLQIVGAPALVAGHADHHHRRRRIDEEAVALPPLHRLLAAKILFHFLKDVGHGPLPDAAAGSPLPHAGTAGWRAGLARRSKRYADGASLLKRLPVRINHRFNDRPTRRFTRWSLAHRPPPHPHAGTAGWRAGLARSSKRYADGASLIKRLPVRINHRFKDRPTRRFTRWSLASRPPLDAAAHGGDLLGRPPAGLGHLPHCLEELAPGVGHQGGAGLVEAAEVRSAEHTSGLQYLMRISYAVFWLK